jgi:hypothetical protein
MLGSCIYSLIDDKSVQITSDSLLRRIAPGKIYGQKLSKDYLVVYGLNKKNRKYTISFWQPASGVSLSYIFKLRKRRFVCIAMKKGAF